MSQHVLLIHDRAPGDVCMTTALVRDIALSRPGEFAVDVSMPAGRPWRCLFDNNPHITPFQQNPPKDTVTVTLDYGPGLKEQNYEPLHFLTYFHRDFEIKTRWKIPFLYPWPDLHLSVREKTQRPIAEPYWLCVPGGKTDFTAKLWAPSNWSKLVRRLNANGLACVQVGSNARARNLQHLNPDIPEMSLNLVGQTSLRELLQLIYHAEGVICGVTASMHFAAALHKPCVVLGGGREAWWWEAYVPENVGLGGAEVAKQLRVPHRYLHTTGLLECCKNHGCWKSHTVPLGDSKLHCYNPLTVSDGATPLCMDMITPEIVETAVLSYYLDGTIKLPTPDPS